MKTKRLNHSLLNQRVRFKMPSNFLDGRHGIVLEAYQDDDGHNIVEVRTTECIGASPAGIVWVVMRHEVELA